MKKRYILTMAGFFLLSATVALAAGDNFTENDLSTPKTYNITVTGTSQPTTTPERVYSIDVAWGSMDFTYNGQKSWNPSTHKYDGEGTGNWHCDENANTVTVTNHSNADIYFILSTDPATNVSDDITINLKDVSPDSNDPSSSSELTCDVKSAVGTEPENAPSKTILCTINGEPNRAFDKEEIGTLTLRIDDAGT